MNLEKRKVGLKNRKFFDFANVSQAFKDKTVGFRSRNSSKSKGKFVDVKGKNANKKGSKFKRIAKRVGIISSLTLLFGFLFGILFILGLVSAYSRDLPNIDEYIDKTNRDEKDTIITDRNGVELYRLQGDTIKERVKLEDVPKKLQWAFLAAEDANFWNHKGLDLTGLTRAFICAARNKGQAVCGGGSSITQQLIKNIGVNNNNTELTESTPKRKIKEAVLAMKIEQKYSKEQILEYYLNLVPEGGVLQGVKSGSKFMFGKENLNDLTLAEMAYLAAIPNEPGVLSPWGGAYYNPERSRIRAEYVLDRMLAVKDSGVTAEEVQKAKEELPTVQFLTKSINKKAPHYVDYVITEVLDPMFANQTDDKGRSGSDYLREKGYVVRTAVDLSTQELLETTVKTQIESEEWQTLVHSQNAAAVLMDPRNGEILAMVGSRDYYGPRDDRNFSPQFNAALAKRSMGSTMKPFNYMNAFMQGYNPSSVVPDIRIDLGGAGGTYYPQNYYRNYAAYGEFISMRTALKWSLNVPAVGTIDLAGLDNYADLYVKLSGFEEFKEEVKGPAAPLGAANLPLIHQVHAYATVANEGVYHEKVAILDIKDSSGKVIYEPDREGQQVIEKKYTYLINDMNAKYWTFESDPVLRSFAQEKGYFGGKTGTGDRDDGLTTDLAFVAYNPNFVMGMWSGNDCGPQDCPITGGTAISSDNLYKLVYQPFLEQYRDKIEPGSYSIPEGVVRVSICSTTGRAWSEDCPGEAVGEYAADTSLPKKEDMVQKVWVTQCGDGYKLARQVDKDANLAEEKKYVVYKFDDPKIQSQVTAYQESKNQLPPKEECNIDRNLKKPEVTIVSPLANSEYGPNDVVRVTASVISDIGIQKVEVYLDNILQKSFTAAPYETTLVLPSSIKTGKHKITVVAIDKRGDSRGETRAEVEILVNNSGGGIKVTPSPTVVPTITPTPTTAAPLITITPLQLNNEED